MNERMSIADKKPDVKSRNAVPQIRRKTESYQSMNSPVDRILVLQRTMGNQAVGKLIKSGALQARLRIGQPDDIYEQEADRVAEQVMRIPDVSEAKDTRIQRKCPRCLRGLLGKDKKDEKLQAKKIRSETPEVTSNMETNINAVRGGSQSLPESERAFFEPRFGQDFSRVRVHSGAAAEQSAREVNANAYTVGHNIVFGAGQFTPGTQEGRRLIAHELTHVVQQSGSDETYAGQNNDKGSLSTISSNELSIQRQSDHPEEQDAEDAIKEESTPCSEIIRHIENLIEALAGRFFDINKPENKGGDAGHRQRILIVQKILGTLITLAKLKCQNGEYDEALDEEASKWRDKKFSREGKAQEPREDKEPEPSFREKIAEALKKAGIPSWAVAGFIVLVIAALADPEPFSKVVLIIGVAAAVILFVAIGRQDDVPPSA